MSVFQKIWNEVNPFAGGKKEVKPSVTASVSSHNQIPYADITILLDKSGSMESMCNDVIGNINEYVKSMRKSPGQNKWSLVQFDTPGYDKTFPHTSYSQRPESEVPFLVTPGPPLSGAPSPRVQFDISEEAPVEYYLPRGGTALVDAMYKTIQEVDGRLSGQYSKVGGTVKPVMMVMTDGQENSSKEYTTEQLKALVGEVQEKGFEFIFLGANMDSFSVANGYGISTDMTKYATTPGSVLTAGATCTNNFTGGIASGAVASGMIGLFSIASGAVYNMNRSAGATI